MAKKDAELRIILSDGERHAGVANVVLQGFDLYMINHLRPLKGKHSHHESGLSHTDHDLIGQRLPGGKRGVSLDGLSGFAYLSGWGAGQSPELNDSAALKSDTKTKRSLVVAPPKHPWGIDVWAIEAGLDDVVERIRETPPWPLSQIAGWITSSWTAPVILVTVWQGVNGSPYEVVRYSPPIPGEVPYVFIPEKWSGTWLEEKMEKRERHPRIQELVEELRRQGRLN